MRTLVCLALTLLHCVSAMAQMRVDAGAAIGFTTAQTSFRQLPGFPSCCPQFDGGSGVGPAFSLGVDVPITGSWFGSVRLGTADRSHTLSTTELIDVIVGNTLVTGSIEHTLDLSLRDVTLEALIGYRIGALQLRAGAGYGWRTFGQLQAAERLTGPSGAVFVDTRTDTRNVRTDDLPQTVTSSAHLVGDVGLDIPLDERRRWVVTPEVGLAVFTASMTSVTSWTIAAPSIGLRLAYAIDVEDGPSVPAVPPVEQIKAVPDIEVPTASAKPAPSDVTLIVDAPLGVRIEEIEEERFMPLLPYVFFERDAAAVPDRYVVQRTAVPVTSGMSTVDVHHRLLPVIAQRLRDLPSAGITLVGTMSADEQDTTLPMRRAQTVAAVLTDVFAIPAERIAVRSRRLPRDASTATGSDAPFADEENRRVEIESAELALFDPIRVADTLTSMTPSSMAFTVTTLGDVMLRNWELGVDGTPIDAAEEPFTEAVVYRPTPQQALAAMRRGTMQASIEGRMQGRRVKDTLDIAVDAVRIAEKRRTRRNDSIVERYELIVFPYSSAELTDVHRRVLASIRDRIGDGARIDIEGCSDVLGPASENRRLSLERARSVATALGGTTSVTARGEPPASTSQRLPEERMLERVVKITVVIPTR